MTQDEKNITNFIIGTQTWFMAEFLDDGLDRAVNNLVEKGGVNTLLIGTHLDYQSTKNWGKLPHNPIREEHAADGFFYNFDISKYNRTRIKPVSSTQFKTQEIDVFNEVLKESRKVGIQCYALILHRFPDVDSYPELHMRTVKGDKVPSILCHHQPEVREFYKCMIDDLIDNYELDGFCLALLDHYHQFGFETLTDELADSLGIKKFSNPEMGLACFCNACTKRAEMEGIDVEKIRNGLIKGIDKGLIPYKVESAITAGDSFRLIMDVPEYLEWLRFRSSLFTEFHKELKEYIKSKNEKMLLSLDIYGPDDAWKYQTDYYSLTEQCKWVKPMFYSGTYPGRPITPEIIGVQTRKCIENSKEGVLVVPGISGLSSESPKEISKSIREAVKNNASGIILSWDYSLIPYENLEIFGNTLRELGKL